MFRSTVMFNIVKIPFRNHVMFSIVKIPFRNNVMFRDTVMFSIVDIPGRMSCSRTVSCSALWRFMSGKMSFSGTLS